MASLEFNWTAPTTHEDGTTIKTPLTYTLYEDSVVVVKDIAVLHFSLLMDGKTHKKYSYTVTATDTATKLESKPSPAVEVAFIAPNPPASLAYSFV